MRRGTPNRFLLTIAAILGIAILAAAGLVVAVALIDPLGDPPHPTDAAMIAQFQRQRPALEALLAMIGEDPELQRLAPDFTRPEPPPISPPRLTDYRARLKAAGIDHGFSHYGDEVTFIVSTRGLAISGSGKSFVHADGEREDAIIVDGDLDAAASEERGRDALLRRPLAPNWWLELDRR